MHRNTIKRLGRVNFWKNSDDKKPETQPKLEEIFQNLTRPKPEKNFKTQTRPDPSLLHDDGRKSTKDIIAAERTENNFTTNFPYQGDQVDQERIAWIQEDFGGISAKFLEGFSSQSFMSSLQLELDCQLLQYK